MLIGFDFGIGFGVKPTYDFNWGLINFLINLGVMFADWVWVCECIQYRSQDR